MLYLVINKSKVLTKESIAEHLWDDDSDMFGSFDFIYSHVKNLRKKVLEAGGKDYKEMIDLKKISIHTDLSVTNMIRMNSNLSQVLIGNLLRNAIKHTQQGGKIELISSKGILKIINSGEEIKSENFKMFERFQKQNSESLGLGLAIVKKVCERYHIKVNYVYNKGMHKFVLYLNTE